MKQLLEHNRYLKNYCLWISLLVLLISGFASLSRLSELSLWSDETWSVEHTRRDVFTILTDRDIGWPPGYFLALAGWQRLGGESEIILRYMGALGGIIGVAAAIQAGRRFHSWGAGWLTGTAFGTASYALTFVLELRGYAFMLPLAFVYLAVYLNWLRRPTWRWSLSLALAQIAMGYIHFVAFFVLALSVLHVLLTKPKLVWQWLGLWLVTLCGALPLFPHMADLFTLRRSAPALPGYMLQPITELVQAYSVHQNGLFALLVLGALLGLLQLRRRWPTILWLLGWGVGIPIGIYLFREVFKLSSPRYVAFTMPPVFLLLGTGLAALPKRWLRGLGAMGVLTLALFPWQPYDLRPAPTGDAPPLREFMQAMRTKLQPEDVFLIDPGCIAFNDPVRNAYYARQSMPFGILPQIRQPEQAGRRVWYVVRQGAEQPGWSETVQKGRVARDFWGYWYLAATLYEAPPLVNPVVYTPMLAFYGATVQRELVVQANDTIKVSLWWRLSENKAWPAELSVGLHLLDSTGKLIAQVDGAPVNSAAGLFVDDRTLRLPGGLPRGNYRLALVVYQWTDGKRLTPSDTTAFTIENYENYSLILDTVPLQTFFNG